MTEETRNIKWILPEFTEEEKAEIEERIRKALAENPDTIPKIDVPSLGKKGDTVVLDLKEEDERMIDTVNLTFPESECKRIEVKGIPFITVDTGLTSEEFILMLLKHSHKDKATGFAVVRKEEDERMTPLAVLLLMLLAHVVEDFHLQGKMADMKQKRWWKAQLENHPVRRYDGMYESDYLPVLLLHGVEWAVCVTIPVMLFCGTILLPDWYCAVVIAMAGVHAGVDHLKCNLYMIDLNIDQSIHIAQVVALWMLADLI